MQRRDDKLDQLLIEQRAADREAIAVLTEAVGKLERAIEAQGLPWFAVALDALSTRWRLAVGALVFCLFGIPLAVVVIGWAVQTFPTAEARKAVDALTAPSAPSGAVLPSAQHQPQVTDPGAVQRLEYRLDPRWNP